MPMVDPFLDNDAFSMISLTLALEDIPFVPGRIGELGLFESQGIPTTSVAIERVGRNLGIIPSAARGAPAHQHVSQRRELLNIEAVHIPAEATINADEVQNVRAFGSEGTLQGTMQLINQRQRELGLSMDVTWEWHRLGAIKGQVLDFRPEDGSTPVLYDLFTVFNVTAQGDVTLNIPSTTGGALRTAINTEIIRPLEDELGGIPYRGIHALVGSAFFDALWENAEIRETYLNTQQASALRERTARRSLDFAGITWEEYRGTVSGEQFIADDEARLFPLGAPNNFISRFAPAPFWDSVNTIGLPRYSRIKPPDADSDSRRVLQVQSNPLFLCTRPRTLFRALVGA